MSDDLALTQTEHDLMIALTLGDNIERACRNKTSPLSRLIAKSREEYVLAIGALLGEDLTSEKGITKARGWQAQAQRYRDMCFWLNEALEEAGIAEAAAEQDVEEDAVEELKEQLYGKPQDRPAPDA